MLNVDDDYAPEEAGAGALDLSEEDIAVLGLADSLEPMATESAGLEFKETGMINPSYSVVKALMGKDGDTVSREKGAVDLM